MKSLKFISLLTALTLCFSSAALAKPKKKTKQTKYDKQVTSFIKKMEKLGDEKYIFHNDGMYVFKYNVKDLRTKEGVEPLAEKVKGDGGLEGCEFASEIGLEDPSVYEGAVGLDDALSTLEVSNQDGALDANTGVLKKDLTALHKKKKIKAIMSKINTGGESEYCSVNNWMIYFSDGRVVDLNYDYTD